MKIFTRMDLIIIILTIVGGTCTLGAGLFKIVNDRRVAADKAAAEIVSKAAEAEKREAEAKRTDVYHLQMVQLVAAKAKVETIANEITQILGNVNREASDKGAVSANSPSLERLSKVKIDMKAVDGAFDEILKGVAPAVAKTIVEREAERKRIAEHRIHEEEIRQKNERAREQMLATVNAKATAILTRAREVIVETVTYTQKTRLGRKIEIHLTPFPEDLVSKVEPTYAAQFIEVGSILFDNGTKWKISLNLGEYESGRFHILPRLSLREDYPTKADLIGFSYDPTKQFVPEYEKKNWQDIKIELGSIRGTSPVAIRDDYLSGKILDDDLFTKMTLYFLGEKEIKDAVRKSEELPPKL